MESPFTETLGDYLRREREARAVSLAELSKSTRISHPYLEAIERNDFAAIPRQEFIQGFLKGYSRHLGLNAEEILRRYYFQCEWAGRKESFEQMSLFGGPAPPPEAIPEVARPEPVRPPSAKKRFRVSVLLQVAIILAAIGLGLYLQYVLKKNRLSGQGAAPAVSAESAGGNDQGTKVKKGNSSGEK
jgi:cytoskeletal protein RodZ